MDVHNREDECEDGEHTDHADGDHDNHHKHRLVAGLLPESVQAQKCHGHQDETTNNGAPVVVMVDATEDKPAKCDDESDAEKDGG